MADDRADQTQRPSVKKGIDSNEQRRRKQDTTLSIRKTKRLESLQKRRQASQHAASEQRDAQFFSPEPSPQPTRHFDPETAFVTRVEENYVVYDKKQEVVFDSNELPKLLRAVMSSDRHLVITATAHFRKLLSIETHPPISQIIRCPRLIERLVSFLRADENPALQFEAAWALTNVASGTPEQTRVVIEHDAVPLFVALLSSPNDDVREQSVWALGNIAGDSPRCRDLVLDAGARDPLIRCIYSAKRITMLRNATWAISNLSRGKPPPPFAKVKPFLSVLSRLIFSIDDEVVTDACWALSYLSEGANERVQALIESGVCRRLVELIMHPHPGVVTPALRTIGNVVTGDDLQTQVVVDAYAVPALVEALHSKKKGIKKEACWTLSNITAGDRSQIEAVIKSEAVKPLVQLLKTAEFDIRKEAAWALSNACSGGSERQIHEVVKHGFIGPLVELLSINDVRMTLVGLDALEHILEAGRLLQHRNQIPKNPYVTALERVDGIKKLDALLSSDNEELFKKANAIINRYCSAVPKEDIYVAPRRGADSYQVNTSHLEDLDDLGGLSDEPGDDD